MRGFLCYCICFSTSTLIPNGLLRKMWKTQTTDDSLKCFNLETMIKVEALEGAKSKEVTMEEYIQGLNYCIGIPFPFVCLSFDIGN